jgi:hypothetical protein
MAICNFNPVTLKTARSNAILSAIGANATIAIYTGSPPLDPSINASGTLLATLSCSTVFGVVTAGVSGGSNPVLTANAVASGAGLANGVPGYARIQTSAGIGVADLDCGAIGSGASVIISPDSIALGALVQIVSATIGEG